MNHGETFSDAVVVPGPNPRSLFVDTEEVDGTVAEDLDADGAGFCTSCHRVFPSTALTCPDDATLLLELPEPADRSDPG